MTYRFSLNLRSSNGSGAHLNGRAPDGVMSQLAGVAEAVAGPSGKPRTLALVSARPGEGTSTCVANLGRYLTDFRHAKVLIVDANPHNPTLHALVGVEPTDGLAGLLSQTMSFEAATKVTPIENLFVVTGVAGSACATNGLLRPSAFRERVLSHTNGFDYVLVDCPAVNVNQDAAATAAVCDGVILIIDPRTTRQSAQAATTVLMRANCNILGVFMNKRRFYVPKFIYDRL